MNHLRWSFAIAAMIGFAPVSRANIIINWNTSLFEVMPGEIVSVTGTLTNEIASRVDLNGIQINLSGPFSTDSFPFLLNSPLWLDPYETSASFEVFTIAAGNLASPGSYSGTATILGGIEGPSGYDASTLNILGSADFYVRAIPEPSGELGIAASSVLLWWQRRRNVERAPKRANGKRVRPAFGGKACC